MHSFPIKIQLITIAEYLNMEIKTRCCANNARRPRYLSLFLFFPFIRGEVLPATFFTASSAILPHPPLSPVFFFQSPSSPAFFTSLLTQSSHRGLGLPRLLLPCSRNSAALFGSLSSGILSTCPAYCNLLLTSIAVKLLCTPLTPPFFACLPSLLLLFFGPSCFRTLAAFVVVVRSEPRFPFRTGMLVWHKCSWPCLSVFLRSTGPPSPLNCSPCFRSGLHSSTYLSIITLMAIDSTLKGRNWLPVCKII